jgi:transcriptional regulator with XRE-family HTH domain
MTARRPRVDPLRELRQLAGMSIRDLETATGINRGRLSILERGVPPSDAESQLILAAIAAGVKGRMDAGEI